MKMKIQSSFSKVGEDRTLMWSIYVCRSHILSMIIFYFDLGTLIWCLYKQTRELGLIWLLVLWSHLDQPDIYFDALVCLLCLDARALIRRMPALWLPTNLCFTLVWFDCFDCFEPPCALIPRPAAHTSLWCVPCRCHALIALIALMRKALWFVCFRANALIALITLIGHNPAHTLVALIALIALIGSISAHLDCFDCFDCFDRE